MFGGGPGGAVAPPGRPLHLLLSNGLPRPPGSREFWGRGSPPRRRKLQEVAPRKIVQGGAE
eukprot:6174449-Alexandrium_andersonii.AAC.1